jgi:hypothetical protein
MKNNYFLRTGLALLIACLLSTGVFAQVAVVGALKNGKASVTNLADATAVLKGGLSATATVSDVYIDREPESGKYFLFGRIGNDPVSGKAVELKLEGGILSAVGGPGIEVTCMGDNCGACIPKVSNWKVRCVCEDNPLKPNYKCDMMSKVIITTW